MKRALTGLIAAGIVAFAAIPAQAAAVVVAKYNMNEPPGATTMVDSSSYGNDGTLHNVQTGVPGWRGTAYQFGNNNPSYVVVPDDPSLDPGNDGWSITARVSFPSYPDSTFDLVRKGLSTTAGGDYKLEIMRSGKSRCLFRGSTGQAVVISDTSLSPDDWHTLRCVKTSNAVKLVVDGHKTFADLGAVGSISNDASLLFGIKMEEGGDDYLGKMDQVVIKRLVP
jgi:hypothetical protein